jgi:hypothetical protein
MSDQENVVEFKLDTLTQAVRLVAGVAPKAMTRVSLGVVLAVDDAANDPAGELLSIKIVEGAKSIVSTVGFIAKASSDKIGSAATSIKRVVSTTVQSASSDQGEAGLAGVVAKLDSVPGLSNARAFVTQAASEVRDSWQAAGSVMVEIVDQDQPADTSLGTDPGTGDSTTTL